MQYRQLGHTDLQVSVICLGTMTYGQQNNEHEAHKQLDFAISQGVNFIDCAEMYPIPPKAKTQGRTETYIGNWLSKQAKREDIIIATKVTGRSDGPMLSHIRRGPRLNKEHIHEAIDGSLKRLQTDYIDVYQLHWPERKTNFFGILGFTPEDDNNPIEIEETLAVLKDLVNSGKVRYIGISNETPWGFMQFLNIAEKQSLPRIVSIQNPYNLLNRSYEIGLAEVSHREKVGLLAYSPLSFGTLSGKYIDGTASENSRLNLWANHYKRYTNTFAVDATRRYVELAKKHKISPAQMALAYVNSRPFVSSNIIGATTLQQLEENIASIDLSLNDEILQSIEEIHTQIPNPAP